MRHLPGGVVGQTETLEFALLVQCVYCLQGVGDLGCSIGPVQVEDVDWRLQRDDGRFQLLTNAGTDVVTFKMCSPGCREVLQRLLNGIRFG